MPRDPKWQALRNYHRGAIASWRRVLARLKAEPPTELGTQDQLRYESIILAHEGALSHMTSLSRARQTKKGRKKR